MEGKRVINKKIKLIFILFFITSFNQNIFSYEWGMGYNSEGIAARVWWNNDIASDITLGGSNGGNYVTYMNCLLTPAIFVLSKTEQFIISAGIKLGTRIYFNISPDYIRYWEKENWGRFYKNEYKIFFMLPHIEMKMPFLSNLNISGHFGLLTTMRFDDNGNFKNVYFWLYGFEIFNFSVIYYFR